MTKTTILLSTLFLVTSVACGKKDGAKKDDKTASKKTDDAPAKADEGPEPEPEPTVAPPKLTATAVGDWGIQIGVPEGGSVGEIEAGDAAMEMPDSTTVVVEAACGYDIDLTRHWAKSLDSMYENAKTGMVDGLSEVEWLEDEKTDAGYVIHYKGKAPLGDMYGMSRGVVVGDRLVLCDSGLGRFEQKEAACLLTVCKSIVTGEGEGEGEEAKGEQEAKEG